MGHDHHHHDDAGNYYVEQLCTIGVCGTLGGVAIMLWWKNQLSFLHPSFRIPVLIGGIGLLVLVAIRAIIVWNASGKLAAAHAHDHQHDHDHGHDHGHSHDHDHAHCHEHGHDHADCDHSHDHGHTHEHVHSHGDDHGHDHSWGPWRYAVLLLPIMFFFLNLPNEGFAQVNIKQSYDHIDPTGNVKDAGFLGEVDFKELANAAYDKDRREHYDGKTVILKGQFTPGPSDTLFSLVRLKLNCCAADAIPLNAIIAIDNKEVPNEKINPAAMQMKWVQVKGQLQFHSRPKGNTMEWYTLVYVHPTPEQPLGDLVRILAPNERPPAYEY